MKCDCKFPEKLGRKERNKLNDGRSRHPLYYIWLGIIHRCSSEKYRQYDLYKGRGIKVSERWQEDFYNFCEDVGDRPSKDHSIDRVENSKGYCKHNVRWATAQEQVNNTRVFRKNGRTLPNIIIQNKKFYVRMRLKGKPPKHLGNFNTIYEAFVVRQEKFKEVYGYNDNRYDDLFKDKILLKKEIALSSEAEYNQFKKYFEPSGADFL